MYKYKFIDLFAGIGGIRRAFDEYGECVFSSEIDKYASISYEANYGEKPHGDITKIDAEEIPTHDILLAGFPCQAFSIAGKREGFMDTRGTLFFEVERILKFHKPKAFLLENVKGLTNHDKGRTFKTMKKSLENLGYNLSYRILNAKDFGLPQNRERIYIVGFRFENNFEFPEPLGQKTKLGDILFDNKLIEDKYTISDKLWEGHQRRKKMHKKKGNGFGYKLYNRNSEYTSTISARYNKDGSEILIKQYMKNPRKITPREGLRLQGFPESFKIAVSDAQMYKQIGNSVPTKVIEYIAEKMILELEKNDMKEKKNVK